LSKLDGWVVGPLGHSACPHEDLKAINPHPIIRGHFGMYANILPACSFPDVRALHEGVDVMIVRENNEGMQPDRNMYKGSGEYKPSPDMALSARVITRQGSERIARAAFELARARGRLRAAASQTHPTGQRPHVTIVHKRSIFKLTCGLFADTAREVAAQFPDVDMDEHNVDSFALELAMKPHRFDTVVVTNMFGDILMDLAAGLVGGLGLVPTLNAGDRYVMAQATHGSAPDIAGRGIANPCAIMLSAQMLLEWLGQHHSDPAAVKAAGLMELVLHEPIVGATARTPDIGKNSSTEEFGQVVVCAIRSSC
jgi:3-isopropylmalate dehydrogenase